MFVVVATLRVVCVNKVAHACGVLGFLKEVELRIVGH